MTTMGKKRDPNQPRKTMKRSWLKRSGPTFMGGVKIVDENAKDITLVGFSEPKKRMRRMGHTRKGEQTRCLELLKKVIIQEVHEANGVEVELLKTYELEHINGRNEPGFKLGAMLDPQNLQLVPEAIHRRKTNATKKKEAEITQRYDFRTTDEQARLSALSERLWAKLGPLKFTAKEFRKALRGELYGR